MTHSDTMAPPPSSLGKLNPEQRKAVETTEGPLLVLAGAGTGKTRVLTARIAHILIQKQAFPSQVLAVTFTNKAAKEMKERVAQLMGQSADGLWLGTFHSIALRILRRHAEAAGLKPEFTILDVDDQLRVLKQLMQEKGIDDKKTPPKLVSAIIQGYKDKALTPDKVRAEGDSESAGSLAALLYPLYQERLKSLNAVDFGDLLLRCVTLFATHHDLLAEYSRRFKYILVDEYQDTNVAQYLWLRLLAREHKNICCVGDDDQSIYGWRGAEVGNILRFEQDFPGACVIRLEQNYRSTPHILAAASGLIARNEGRLGKTLWTEASEGEKIRILSVWDDQEEARRIADEIESLQRKKESLGHMAILVRAGFQTRSFEERFMQVGVPYRIVGGFRFYERQEIRDAIAYIRATLLPSDDLAFERIMNVPKRGLGTSTLELLHRTARARNIPLAAAAGELIQNGEMRGKAASALSGLLGQFATWRGLLGTMPHPELVDLILEESGYREMWKQEKSADAQGRLENLRELVRALQEFENLTAFLEHVSLVSDNDAAEEQDMVTLMTLHAAKGLEFNHVFLPGWEEGLFPHQRALDESGRDGLEEERRLAYVGLTRARVTATITHASNRRIYNQWQSSLPSRFLAELPPEHVEKEGGQPRRFQHSGWDKSVDEIMDSVFTGGSAAASRTPTTGIGAGTRVFHQKFGYGIVKSNQGGRLEVAFDKAGFKKVLEGFVERA